MKGRPGKEEKAKGNEAQFVRKNLIRRAAELAMIRGRRPDEPTREDLQQAKRELKPLDMAQQERV